MTCPIRPIGSGNEHCPYDWLAVYDGRDEHSPLIGKFCGLGKFPFSIIGTSQYMYVEFVTSPAGPLLNTGFHFNVGNWPGHVETAGIKHGICDWLLSSDSLKDSSASEGIFLSIAHWYPPNTSCSYHIKGRTGEIVRLYFPSFNEMGQLVYQMNMYDSLGTTDILHRDDLTLSVSMVHVGTCLKCY
ncbi:tolloid-like protein 1 isoform X1 [Lucilia cuprina]|uniref:tolloid-like protein 1 isoform X1 n=1 Tax=Lucilia cuprina TaxID=7375 RepID=UPI001F06F1E8|nr:tolloid-like protein 1 isoform X1 [Lucilia cuprina]